MPLVRHPNPTLDGPVVSLSGTEQYIEIPAGECAVPFYVLLDGTPHLVTALPWRWVGAASTIQFLSSLQGNGVTVPGNAAQWTVDPTTTGLAWFGWGSLDQINAEEYSPSLPRSPTPSWMTDTVSMWLDDGNTWFGMSLQPGIARSDGDWFAAWLADGCTPDQAYQSKRDFFDHAYWPIEGQYYWTYLDFKVEVAKEVKRQAALRGITVHFYIKYTDYNPNKNTSIPANSYSMAYYPSRYGDLLLAAVQRYDTVHGILVEGIDAINEPRGATGGFTPARISDAILDAKAKLNAAGYYPIFFAPSTSAPESFDNTMFNTLYNSDGGSWRSVWQPSSHLYSSSVTDPADADVEFSRLRTMLATQGKGFIQTEYPTTPLRLIWAMVYGDLIGNLNYATAYGATTRNQLFHLNKGPDTLEVMDHTLGQRLFSRYIRPGMLRCAVTKANSLKSDMAEAVAFVDPDTGKTVTVMVAQQVGQKFFNLLPGTYKVIYQLGSETSPMTGQGTGSFFNAGAADLAGRSYTLTNGQGIEATVDTAGAAGVYAAIEQ